MNHRVRLTRAGRIEEWCTKCGKWRWLKSHWHVAVNLDASAAALNGNPLSPTLPPSLAPMMASVIAPPVNEAVEALRRSRRWVDNGLMR